MKRSGQIALVLMGVTGTTAAGAYMMPPRPQCQPAPASVPGTPAIPPSALSADPAAAQQPCRRRSWGSWRWSGNSHSYYSYNNTNNSWSPRSWFPSTRSGSPTSTSIAPTTSGPRSGGPSTSTPRGGFGTTGHSISTGS